MWLRCGPWARLGAMQGPYGCRSGEGAHEATLCCLGSYQTGCLTP